MFGLFLLCAGETPEVQGDVFKYINIDWKRYNFLVKRNKNTAFAETVFDQTTFCKRIWNLLSIKFGFAIVKVLEKENSNAEKLN